ncbi:MAG TPA: hypothetical protein VNW73_08860 [Ktedonobacteraceae bacterium]|nr:hypothetical protein [Ktedonobacteraceae bacterium]
MTQYFRHHHRIFLTSVLLVATAMLVLAAVAGARSATTHAAGATAQTADALTNAQGECQRAICTFQLQVNPGLTAGHPFACPAIQHAHARITISDRFITGAQNDVMILTASGLPKNTGFDVFLVQNSPLDSSIFAGFGFGWYQSDLESDSFGHTQVNMQGVFDKETFIENPADAFNPIHTFNVGFWFNSPTEEQQVCGNTTAPAATPFNGEQNAGLLAMITQGEPLQFVVGH